MILTSLLVFVAVLLAALWRRAVDERDAARGELVIVRLRNTVLDATGTRAARVLDLAARVYLSHYDDEEPRVDGQGLPEAADALRELEREVVLHLQGRGDITEDRAAEMMGEAAERHARMIEWGEPTTATPIEDLMALRDFGHQRSYTMRDAPDFDFPEELHEVPDAD